MHGSLARSAWIGKLWMVAAATLLCGLAACGGGGGGGDPVPTPVAPSITTQLASISVQAGQSANFSVVAAGDGPLSYQWLRNSREIAGAVQSSYSLVSATMADSGGLFAVRVTNPAGTVTSAEAALTVTMPGSISLVVPRLGTVLDLATDAQGNTIAVLPKTPGNSEVVARKFAPDGSELSYGPDGRGVTLPGAPPTAAIFFSRYSGAAFASSGEIYVSTVTARDAGFGMFEPTGGSLSRVSSSGQVTVLADWPAGSAGAVAPVSVTLGPDGALYFVDYISGHLMKRTSAGAVTSVADVQAKVVVFFGNSRFFSIAVESADRAYVIDRSRSPLLKRVQGGVVSVLAGNATAGPGLDGSGTSASFESPSAISLGNDGTLYVADGSRLRSVTSAGVVTTVAGTAGSNALVTGPLPGSLGPLGSMTIGADGVIQVISLLGAEASLVKIRLR